MGTPFLGELRMLSFNYAPKGWAQCNGQPLPINQNQALFSLFGTMYGGNGQTTFALPDLRGRTPIHIGSGFTQGQNGGQSAVTITLSTMPAHNHLLNATSAAAASNNPAGAFFAQANVYLNTLSSLTTWHPATITSVGGSQPHENRQPYLVINWSVALQGAFPPQ